MVTRRHGDTERGECGLGDLRLSQPPPWDRRLESWGTRRESSRVDACGGRRKRKAPASGVAEVAEGIGSRRFSTTLVESPSTLDDTPWTVPFRPEGFRRRPRPAAADAAEGSEADDSRRLLPSPLRLSTTINGRCLRRPKDSVGARVRQRLMPPKDPKPTILDDSCRVPFDSRRQAVGGAFGGRRIWKAHGGGGLREVALEARGRKGGAKAHQGRLRDAEALATRWIFVRQCGRTTQNSDAPGPCGAACAVPLDPVAASGR